MYEIHAEANEEYNESCHYCTQLFKTKRDVMLHSKKWHKEKGGTLVLKMGKYICAHTD